MIEMETGKKMNSIVNCNKNLIKVKDVYEDVFHKK